MNVEKNEDTEAAKKTPTSESPRKRTGTRSEANGSSGRGGYRENSSHGGDSAGSDSQRAEKPRAAPMEVLVDHSIERAMKVLKRKLIKEGLFKELKARRYFEKPSERKKRKQKESVKKLRKEEARQKKNSLLF